MNASGHGQSLKIILPLFGAALVLKAGFLFAARDNPYVASLMVDEQEHFRTAQEVLQKGLLRDDAFYFAPLYPYLLAGFFKLFGENIFAFKILQTVVGALNVVAVFSLGKTVFQATRTGLIAAVLTLLYGVYYLFEVLLLKETLAVLLTNLALLVLFTAARRKGVILWLLSGALLGLTSLLRGNILLVIPFIAGGMILDWLANRPQKKLNAAGIILLGLGVLLGASPATIHNCLAAHEFILTTYQGGTNFYIGNHAGATGIYTPLRPDRQVPEWEKADAVSIAEAGAGRKLRPSEVSSFWFRKSLSFITSQPGKWLGLTLKKAWMFHENRENEDTVDYAVFRQLTPLLRLAFLPHGLIIAFAVFGLGFTLRDWRRHLILYMALLGSALSVILFFIFSRYRLPGVSLYIILAALAIDKIIGWLGRRKYFEAVAVLALAAMLFGVTCVQSEKANPAASYNNLALKYYGMGKYPEARRYFDMAIEAGGPTFGFYSNLSLVCEKMNDNAAAVTYLRKALEFLPASIETATDDVTRQQLAETKTRLARALEHAGRKAEAAHTLRQLDEQRVTALLKSPPGAERDFQIGQLYAKLGDDARALEYYSSSIRQNAGNPQVFIQLGLTQAKLERYSDALGSFTQAAALQPDSAYVHKLLGNVHYSQNRPPDALKEWEISFKLNPSDDYLRTQIQILQQQNSPSK